MTTLELTGYDLYYSFLSGFKEVKKHYKMLNRINVFPVADGDTGSNLLSTLASIIYETKATDSFKDTMGSIAEAALNGARGNSGIIFAQFINGINDKIKEVEVIDADSLLESINKAVPYAYSAIIEPIEGTIITVIREWADTMCRLKKNGVNKEEFISASLEAARQSLDNTPNLLDVLKKSSVVDSGACGFVTFLEGAFEYIKNKSDKDIDSDKVINSYTEDEILEEETDIEFADEHINPTDQIKYRYCTEALIANINEDMSIIKNEMKVLGDSLIIAGSSEKSRIHIHTNNPAEVFNKLRGKGDILQQKVEDMIQQYQIANNRLYNIAIVTDSIADLPKELIEKYQIHVIPLNLNIEGSQYLDKLTIEPRDFYQLLDGVKEYPTSSLPSQKTVEAILDFLTNYYDYVVAITVSKAMSGTFQAVERASQKYVDQGKQIKVIDSKLNSGAQGLLVLEAARCLEEGKNFGELIEHIENQIKKTKIFVSVKTIKYMVRGGRISPIKGMLGKLLNIKPIVSIDSNGNGIAFGKAYSSSANINKIIEILKKENEQNEIKGYCIVHANAEEKARELEERIIKEIALKSEYINEISTIVGLNAGIGALAVCFTQK